MEKYNITISKEELKKIIETDDYQSFQELVNNIYDKLLLLEAEKLAKSRLFDEKHDKLG